MKHLLGSSYYLSYLLFTQNNLEHLLRTLKPDAIIKVATDHAEYFEQIVGRTVAADMEKDAVLTWDDLA